MWRARHGEVRPLSDRARRAYQRLLSDEDPAADWLAAGAADLRPFTDGSGPAPAGAVVVGPDDLREIREIVDTQLGVGCWPRAEVIAGERRTVQVALVRGAATALVHAFEGRIEQRSPWGRWRSAVDIMAARLDALDTVTLDAIRAP